MQWWKKYFWVSGPGLSFLGTVLVAFSFRLATVADACKGMNVKICDNPVPVVVTVHPCWGKLVWILVCAGFFIQFVQGIRSVKG